MTCFTTPVEEVSNVRLFARTERGGTQLLAWQCNVRSNEVSALVLPIPTPLYTSADKVEFIDVEGCPGLFQDLHDLFGPDAFGSSPSIAGTTAPDKATDAPRFLSSAEEFGRLEEDLRPGDAWEGLRRYQSWGFIVVPVPSNPGKDLPLMAARFPTQRPRDLCFPTLQLHDGELGRTAYFDHFLYAQRQTEGAKAWARSSDEGWAIKKSPIDLPEDFTPPDATADQVEIEGELVVRRHYQPQIAVGTLPEYLAGRATAGLIDPTVPLHRLRLVGEYANTDFITRARTR